MHNTKLKDIKYYPLYIFVVVFSQIDKIIHFEHFDSNL